MSAIWPRVRRWFGGTSNRTFVVWPIVLIGWQALWASGWPALDPWGLPLLAWGYLQYKLVGRMRTREGGGGPGMSKPPQRLVTSGPYGLVRNPMYLGHMIFFLGLALLLHGWAAWAVFAAHLAWFDWRARRDEAHLRELFGEPYDAYLARVKRWVPGVY